MAPINVAVIGYGLSARIFHIPFILALKDTFALHTIIQRNPDAATNSTGISAVTDHPGVRVLPSTHDLLTDPAIDLIIITTPPDSHFALCYDALRAGKHVVCEKPFVATAEEARELAGHAEACDKVLAVYQNRRWDAEFATLRELYSQGKLGRVVEMQTHFDRHRPAAPPKGTVKHAWKSDKDMPANGSIFDLGTHLIDQVVALLGVPARVTAFLGVQREGRVGGEVSPSEADSFTAILHFKDGAMVTAKAGVVSPMEEQLRFWVRGTEGTYRKNHLDVQEDQLVGGLMPWQEGYGVEPEGRAGTLTTSKDGQLTTVSQPNLKDRSKTQYIGYYETLAKAIKGEGSSPVTPLEAATVLKVIEQAIESSRTWSTKEIVL